MYPMTQDALAQRAGVSSRLIQTFENATRRTNRTNVEKIASACGFSMAELLAPGDEVTRPHPPSDLAVHALLEGNPEASGVAKMFVFAATEVRAGVKAALRDNLERRRNAEALLRTLYDAGTVLRVPADEAESLDVLRERIVAALPLIRSAKSLKHVLDSALLALEVNALAGPETAKKHPRRAGHTNG
jgi:transcriptional regulator with XRE-family HTH domain